MKKTNNELATICTICTTVLFEEEITQQTKKSIVRQEQRRCEDEPPHLVWQRERERERRALSLQYSTECWKYNQIYRDARHCETHLSQGLLAKLPIMYVVL